MHETSPLVETVAGLILLLIIAATVSAAGKRIRLPFTVMLVVIGAGIAMISDAVPVLSVLHSLNLSPDMILYIFLPTLVFESSFNMDARQLWQNIMPVLTLAVPGLMLSTGIIGGIVALTTVIPLTESLLLGAILSATDPVAVIALFKRLGAPKRLTILVEGESLFNDATAIVLATILVASIGVNSSEHAMTLGSATADFFVVFFGGMVVGWILGMITSILLGLVRSDVYIETTLTTILAYASFLLAEQAFHVSGVVAVVMAGMTLGNWGRIKISPRVRHYVDHFWEYMAFVATALIFLMVGMRVELSALWESADILGWVILGMLLSRAMVIYGMIPISNRLTGLSKTGRDYQHVMFWGGLRGAIALAIVLSLPEFPYNEIFVALVMGAVLFTLLVQGLSIEWLVAKLGLNRPSLSDRIAESEGMATAIQQAINRLPDLQRGGLFSGSIASKLQKQCRKSLEKQQKALKKLREKESDNRQETIQLYLRCYANEQAQYNDLFNKGHLSERTLRELLGVLAAQIDSIRFDEEYKPVNKTMLPVRRLQHLALSFLEKLFGNTRLMESMRLDFIVISYEEAWGRFHSSQEIIRDLDQLESVTGLDGKIVNPVRQQYTTWKNRAEDAINQMTEQYPEFVSAMQKRLGMRLILLAEIQSIDSEAHHGNIPHSLAGQMQETLYRRLWDLRGQEIQRLRVKPDELLKKVPFFANTTEEEFLALSQKMKRHSVAPREAIIRQGEKGNALFLIARGVVRISREQDGISRDLTSLFAGDFFGEMALLHDEERTATVTSISPCTLYRLEREDVQDIMAQNPSIRLALEKADEERRQEQLSLD